MDEEEKNISWAAVGRKCFDLLKSMQLSIVILCVILIACVIGSVIPQGQAEAVYAAAYGSTGARIIRALSLDRIFTCTWFALLSLLLCVNLTLCSVSRFPGVLKRYRKSFSAEQRFARQDASFALELPEGFDVKHLGLRTEAGRLYCAGNRIGIWGSWLCHLGMLLVIIGFALGQMFSREYEVYGIDGAVLPMGDTGITVSIDDFQVRMRRDFTVEQYEAALTVSDSKGSTVQGTASVNHPMSALGYTLYQDSTGWACYVDICYDGELLRQDLLCVGEYTYPDQLPTLIFQLNRFFPDLLETEAGYETKTPLLNNPHALYSVYYNGQKIAMGLSEPGAPIELGQISFTIHDPTQYTLLVVKTDPTVKLVGVAGALMILGILLAFYCRPYEMWSDGRTLWVKASKAPELLRDSLTEKIERSKNRA